MDRITRTEASTDVPLTHQGNAESVNGVEDNTTANGLVVSSDDEDYEGNPFPLHDIMKQYYVWDDSYV